MAITLFVLPDILMFTRLFVVFKMILMPWSSLQDSLLIKLNSMLEGFPFYGKRIAHNGIAKISFDILELSLHAHRIFG